MSEDESELPADLREFVDRLIVPLLVERMKNGHLYSASPSQYDDVTGGVAPTAEEAA